MVTDENQAQATKRVGGRRARTDVARAMILAAVASVLMIGLFNFFQSRSFLQTEVQQQLEDVGASRGVRVERGIEDLTRLVESIAADPIVSDALVTLSEGFNTTDESLDPSQLQDLKDFYSESVVGTQLPGGAAIGPEVFPSSSRTQYLQYWYIADNPFEDRAELADPGDGSTYSEAHAQYHATFGQLASNGVVQDLMLIDRNGDIVYTIEKRIDFAGNIFDGPHADEAISGVIGDLQALPAGEAALVDFSVYPPAAGEIEMWVVTLVRTGDEFVGALAASIPNQAVVDIVTASGMWEETGLGETGEVYIVGADGLLRTESRQFLTDPNAYVAAAENAGYGTEMIDSIELFGTTVLIQPAGSEAVAVAQLGDEFTGWTSNYLDEATLSVSGPLEPRSLGWVIVSEMQRSEVSAPLYAYLWRLGIASVLVIAVVVVIALYAASRLLRPIDPIVDAARRVGEGDLDVRLPDAGRDEFAYLSDQFNQYVDELVRRGDEVAATEAETTELLASVVPRRLVDKVMAGNRDIAEAMSDATLVALTIKGSTDNIRNLEQLAEHNAELVGGMVSLADRYGAEQLSSSAVTFLYATGLNVEDPRIEDAVEFAVAASEWLSDALASQGYLLGAAVGVASGDVVTGVMGTERLAVDVLGAPRQVAGALSAAASPRQVLVDAEIAGAMGDEWQLERVRDLEDISGSPLDAWQVKSRTSV